MDKEIKPVPTSIVWKGHEFTAEWFRALYWNDGLSIKTGIPTRIKEITGKKPNEMTISRWFVNLGIEKRPQASAMKIKYGEDGIPTIDAIAVRYWGKEGHKPHSLSEIAKWLHNDFNIKTSTSSIRLRLIESGHGVRTKQMASKIAYRQKKRPRKMPIACMNAAKLSASKKQAALQNVKKAWSTFTEKARNRAFGNKRFCRKCGGCYMATIQQPGKQLYRCLDCRASTIYPLTEKPQMVNGKPVLPPKPPRTSKPRQESPKPTPKAIDDMELTEAELDMMKRFRGES